MSNYSERTEQQSGDVSSETDDTALYLKPSPVLKFASGPDICQQQGEDESPASRDQTLKTKYDKNWTKKVQMGTIIKDSKATKLQDTILGVRAVDINSNSVLQNSNAKPPSLGTDNKATTAPRTNEHHKKHGASRRLKESYGRASPPSEIRPTSSRTLSNTAAEDLNYHAVPNMKRRRSDPSVNRQHVNRKTKPASLIRRVSPLQLLNKVTTTSNTKAVGALSPRLAKRLGPTISKVYCQLGARDRAGGSDPTINTAHEGPENEFGPFGGGHDFPSQIHYLAEDIERLNIHQYEGARKIKEGEEIGAISPRDGETRQMCFKHSDVKLQELMEDILRVHLLALTDYKPASCDRTSRNICKLISNFVSAMKTSTHAQSKFICLVYIGAVRDQGLHVASRALWNPEEDSFAAASFRNEFVYGLAVVLATPID